VPAELVKSALFELEKGEVAEKCRIRQSATHKQQKQNYKYQNRKIKCSIVF